MLLTCTECGEFFEVDEFPFGDDVTCTECGARLETDWDYVDAYEGSMGCWVTGPAPKSDEE